MHELTSRVVRNKHPEHERGHSRDDERVLTAEQQPGEKDDQHCDEREFHGDLAYPIALLMEDMPPGVFMPRPVILTIRLCQPGHTMASRRSGDQSSSGYQVQS